MPTYCYKCKDCETEFEVRHSMSYEEQSCIKCNSSSVFKIPSLRSKPKVNLKTAPGKIVDEYIKDARVEINSEKKMLKSREL